MKKYAKAGHIKQLPEEREGEWERRRGEFLHVMRYGAVAIAERHRRVRETGTHLRLVSGDRKEAA